MLSTRDREWTKLEVMAKQQKGDQGFVEFKAWYRDDQDAEHVMHEKSVFQRVGARWLYIGGEVNSSPGAD